MTGDKCENCHGTGICTDVTVDRYWCLCVVGQREKARFLADIPDRSQETAMDWPMEQEWGGE